MAITNGYCTLAELKTALAITDAVDDTPLEAAVNAASRMIDDYTGRFFYADGTTIAPVYRYYTPLNDYSIAVDDFSSISAIATDENLDQTYGTAWAATDYLVEPKNNVRRGWSYSRLIAIGRYIWPSGLPQSVRVYGAWGWLSTPSEVNMAALIQASRLFVRRQSPFGIAGSPDLGTVRLSSRVDADVEALLRPFRKNNGLAK